MMGVMWDGRIDTRHLYSALRLTAVMHNSDGSPASGYGTGFVIEHDLFHGGGHKGYLVTNRHVLDPNFKRYVGRTLTEVTVKGHYQHVYHAQTRSVPSGDIRQIEFKIRNPEPIFPPEPVDLAVIDLDAAELEAGQLDINSIPAYQLAGHGTFERALVTVGSQVLMPGYPAVGQDVADRPILVSGTIASDPRYSAAIGGTHLPASALCHSFSWSGMSGSPVFAIASNSERSFGEDEKPELVVAGINAGHITSDGAQGVLTHFVKAPALVQLLHEAPDHPLLMPDRESRGSSPVDSAQAWEQILSK